MLDTVIANGQVVTPQGAGASEIGINPESDRVAIAADEGEFIETLSRVLKSRKTRQVIQAILSQITD